MRFAHAALAIALTGSILAPAPAQAAPAFASKTKQFVKTGIEYFKNFRAAKSEVKALRAASPDLNATYKSTFKASNNSGLSSLITGAGVFGLGAHMATAKVGLLAAASASPTAALALAYGASGIAEKRSEAHRDARVAVIGQALQQGKTVSPRARTYFLTHAEGKLGNAQSEHEAAATHAGQWGRYANSLSKQIELAKDAE